MKSYVESEVFSERELALLALATAAVAQLPQKDGDQWVRCHEVARAVGRLLSLEVCDGWYGMVNHSWLWTRGLSIIDGAAVGGLPNILDVYVPGRLPQVQLIHTSTALPFEYRRGDMRTDIDHELVELLIQRFRQ